MSDSFPISVGDLTLRRVGPTDVRDLYDIYSLPEVARYEFWEPWTLENVENQILSQSQFAIGDPGVPLVVGVTLDRESKLIGDCQLTIHSVEDRQAEIGFTFHPAYGGRGYATRAVRACLGFAFAELGMHRVTAAVDVRDERSWKLMERIGMRREAHFIHDSFVKGQWIDDYIYAMLDDEWSVKAGDRC